MRVFKIHPKNYLKLFNASSRIWKISRLASNSLKLFQIYVRLAETDQNSYTTLYDYFRLNYSSSCHDQDFLKLFYTYSRLYDSCRTVRRFSAYSRLSEALQDLFETL